MTFSKEQASQQQADYFAEQVGHFREQAETLNEQADDLMTEASELRQQADDFMEQAQEARKEAELLVQQAGFYKKQVAYCQEQEKLAKEHLQAHRAEPAPRPLLIFKNENDDGDDSKANIGSPFSASTVTVAGEAEATDGGLWLTTELCDFIKTFVWKRHGQVSERGLASLPRLGSMVGIPYCQPAKKRPGRLLIITGDPHSRERRWPGHSLSCQNAQVERLYKIYACALHASMGSYKALGLTDLPAHCEVNFDHAPLWNEAATAECRCREGPVTFYRPEQARCPDTGKNIVGWVPFH
jgi:hypothetical protein